MLSSFELAKFACRASNIYERLEILQELAFTNALDFCQEQLSPLDIWTINKLAGKLAVTQIKQHFYQEITSKLTSKSHLQKILQNYKLYEINIENISESQREIFIKFHLEWLPIYQAALATLNLPPNDFINSCWYEPEIYYQRFGKIIEPFLRWLQQKLQSVCAQINTNEYIINQEALGDIQLNLVYRFERAIAHAIEADIKLYCHQNQMIESSDTEAYIAYLEQTFYDENSYHQFYSKFPVLARWLAQVTYFLSEVGTELIQRLTSDRIEISNTFFDGIPIKQVQGFRLSQSDSHAGGHTVVIIDFELVNSHLITVVYKPRCIQSEAAMQGLLTTLKEADIVNFATYRVLCKDSYGYAEFLPLQNHTQSLEAVEKFYQQMGGYLAIFYILGGSDLHFENILVSNCNAFICDCETILEVLPNGTVTATDLLSDSVFRTGMLDWPRSNKNGENLISLSGYNGGKSYEAPFAIPQINNRMSLNLAVEHKVGVNIEVAATNRLYYKGELINPQDYKKVIVDGFNKVYQWMQNHPTQIITLVEELFSHICVRFVNRATQIYAHLLDAARHPKCLAEPLEVDLVLHKLIEHPRVWDDVGKLAKLELTALWQLDIPIFTAKANQTDLIYNYQQNLANSLVISPLNNAKRRIRNLSLEQQTRQNQYIYASLSIEEINSQHFIDLAVNYAQQIGMQLYSLMQDSSALAPWKNIDFTATGKQLVDINGSLYSGSAGICLFFAYLNAITPQPEFRQAAERALSHAIAKCDRTMIGAFQGKAGLIYLLTHLAQLWKQSELLDLASELSGEIISLISEDTYYDIIHGSAGVIPVMLGLAEAVSGRGMSCAIACAEHLLQNAVRINDTLSWQFNPELARGNLTGFSHGASGIGWALIRLGAYTNQSKYIQAGIQAFAYEKTQFDPVEGNWYDLRTSVMTKQAPGAKFAYFWCSGAAGIGLSRIDSWAILGKQNQDILDEARTALDITLRHFHILSDDALCHGKAGNTELLLRFAKLTDEPYLQMEANAQATEQWRNFEKARRWTCGAGGNDILPDLMNGLAGIGMHFLRLAYPERVPSPLLLDIPAKNEGY